MLIEHDLVHKSLLYEHLVYAVCYTSNALNWFANYSVL